MIRFLTICIAFLGFANPIIAKQPVQIIMKQLYSLNASVMSYNYKVQMIDVSTGRFTDSISGTLYRNGKSYLDSSTAGFTCMNGIYYAKVEHRSRKAIVYDLKELQHRYHVNLDDINPTGLQVLDSLPIVNGSLRVDSTDANYYRVTWQVKGMYAQLNLLLRKRDLKVIQFQIDKTEYEHGQAIARYLYSIFNIRNEAPMSLINPHRVFTIRNNKVALHSHYAGYSLTTITN